MMTVEMIYGKEALRELAEPCSDPVVAKFEAKVTALLMETYRSAFKPEPMRDELPAHYRKVKINS